MAGLSQTLFARWKKRSPPESCPKETRASSLTTSVNSAASNEFCVAGASKAKPSCPPILRRSIASPSAAALTRPRNFAMQLPPIERRFAKFIGGFSRRSDASRFTLQRSLPLGLVKEYPGGRCHIQRICSTLHRDRSSFVASFQNFSRQTCPFAAEDNTAVFAQIDLRYGFARCVRVRRDDLNPALPQIANASRQVAALDIGQFKNCAHRTSHCSSQVRR